MAATTMPLIALRPKMQEESCSPFPTLLGTSCLAPQTKSDALSPVPSSETSVYGCQHVTVVRNTFIDVRCDEDGLLVTRSKSCMAWFGEVPSSAEYAGAYQSCNEEGTASDAECRLMLAENGDASTTASTVHGSVSSGSLSDLASVEQSEACPSKGKDGGKRRKSGWTRQRRSRALARISAETPQDAQNVNVNGYQTDDDIRTPSAKTLSLVDFTYSGQLPNLSTHACTYFFGPVCAHTHGTAPVLGSGPIPYAVALPHPAFVHTSVPLKNQNCMVRHADL